MKKKLTQGLMFIGLVISISQCSEVQPETSLSSTETIINEKKFEPSQNIEFNGEYLVFRTPELFDQTLNSIRNTDPHSVRDWSDKLGFTSMRAIYEKAYEEQEKSINALEAEYKSYPPNDPRLKAPFEQPAFVRENETLFAFNEKGLIAQQNVPLYDVTALINKNGLVKVAGHLFQYNKDNIKIIMGGDESKISMLANVNETNKKLKIVVNPITRKWVDQSSSPEGRYLYDWSAKSMEFVGSNVNYTFYYNMDVQITSRSEPMYDTTPVCEPAGCGEVRTMDCTCYFPIIGYIGFTTFESHMEVRRKTLGLLDVGYQPSSSTITVDYKIDNGAWSNDHSYTSHNLSNTYITLYDGTPMVNFTCGSHDFSAVIPSPAVSTVINHSWCD